VVGRISLQAGHRLTTGDFPSLGHLNRQRRSPQWKRLDFGYWKSVCYHQSWTTLSLGNVWPVSNERQLVNRNRCIAIVGSTGAPSGLTQSERYAVQLAMQLGDGIAEVYVPPGDFGALQYAVAAGAQPGGGITPHVDFDVAVMATAGLGPDGDITAAALAKARGAALAFDIMTAQCEGDSLVVVRDVGRGIREQLRIQLPAVMAISSSVPRPAYVSRFRVRSAGVGTDETLLRATFDLGLLGVTHRRPIVDERWEPLRPRVATTSAPWPNGQSRRALEDAAFGLTGETTRSFSGGVLTVDADTGAEHLLRFLAHHGFIEARSNSGSRNAAPVVPRSSGSNNSNGAELPGHRCGLSISPGRWPSLVGATLRSGYARRPRKATGRSRMRSRPAETNGRTPRLCDRPTPGMARRPRRAAVAADLQNGSGTCTLMAES
jgi:hypothetical protein